MPFMRHDLTRTTPTNVFNDRRLLLRWRKLGIIDEPLDKKGMGRTKGIDFIESDETAARLVVLADYYETNLDGNPPYLSKALGDKGYLLLLSLIGAFPLNENGWEALKHIVIQQLEAKASKFEKEIYRDSDIDIPDVFIQDGTTLISKTLRSKMQGTSLTKLKQELEEYPSFDEIALQIYENQWDTIWIILQSAFPNITTQATKEELKKELYPGIKQIITDSIKLKSPKGLVKRLNEIPVKQWKELMQSLVTFNYALPLYSGFNAIPKAWIFESFKNSIDSVQEYLWQLFTANDLYFLVISSNIRKDVKKGMEIANSTYSQIWEGIREQALDKIKDIRLPD